jgi:hypothetical protein
MKPSEEIKEKYGFESMKEVSDKSKEHSNNLISWHKLYPRRFELVMKGLVFERILKRYGVLNDENAEPNNQND